MSPLQARAWDVTIPISKALQAAESVRSSRNFALQREANYVRRRFRRRESLRARFREHLRSVADALSSLTPEEIEYALRGDCQKPLIHINTRQYFSLELS